VKITLDTTDYHKYSKQNTKHLRDPLRITLIDSNGTVLADTEVDASSLENHADRNEVSEAILFGEGSSVRYSATLRENELYYALRTSNGTIIRAMIPISNLWTDFLHFLPYLILSAAVAMLTSVFISKSMSRSALRPLTDIAEKLVSNRERFTVKLPYSDLMN
jgi:two-component system phosphate regulon sensor histidine kinase PhoR